MSYWLAKPIEELLIESGGTSNDGGDPVTLKPIDTLIVGSGYGAAMAALALAMNPPQDDKPPQIYVFERGQEYVPGDFPKTIGDVPGYVAIRRNGGLTGNADALWDIRVGDGVSAVVGNGLGARR